MKTSPFLIRVATVLAILSMGVVVSCSDDEPRFAAEAAYAIEETSIDAYYADADDMAGVAVAESDETEGNGKISATARELKIQDDRFCNNISISLENILLPSGNIILDFGTGCTDLRKNVRKGKIKIHFEGRKFRPNSLIAISFETYEINGVMLNGTRTLTNLEGSTVASPKFQIELKDGSISWKDKVATREHCFNSTWDRGALLNPNDDAIIIDQCTDVREAAEGVNRKGIQYEVFIEETLIYKRGCPVAVSGVKRFVEVKTGKEIIIDYGRGTCDTSLEITVNGSIHNIRSGQ